MARPYVGIDLDKIEHNARSIVALCRAHGLAVTGVTKGTCGHPAVARAMLRGGVSSLGESRMENVARLRDAGVRAPMLLLRLPPLSEAQQVVDQVDVSLNSELAVLEALSEAARRRERVHDVIVMVDLGDLREGVWPDDLLPFVRETLRMRGVRVAGLGTNLGCYGGVVPSEENMGRLVEHAREIEAACGIALAWISGGSSNLLPLLAAGRLPARINHARIGEAILLGRETTGRRPWPGTWQDAFRLHAEVIEEKEKPSLPIGERGADAFGRRPRFEDRGERERALVNVGREDVDVEGIAPVDPRLAVLGASSDYLIVDVTEARGAVRVGDEMVFSLDYAALLATMTSHYVEKRVRGGGEA